MRIVFVSNYYNHHQSAFSEALFTLTKGSFRFIENEPMESERVMLGWGGIDKPSFVLQAYKSKEDFDNCVALINCADIVIFENTARRLVEERIKEGRITFLYSERIFKRGFQMWKMPVRFLTWGRMYRKYKNLYLLCASAYTSYDFFLTGNFINKSYKWGYFPEFVYYDDLDVLLANKKKGTILWCARFIDWKHPEMPVLLAEKLKNNGYFFEMKLIGNGPMKDDIDCLIKSKRLEDCVCLVGSMTPHEVRHHMEESDIFIFTSDFNEGWGVVLNEAMNSACTVVCSHAIGAVPYLIKNNENGFVFKNKNINDLYEKVAYILANSDKTDRIKKNAFLTIKDEWNAQQAATKFIELSSALLNKDNAFDLFDKGICSKAELVKNNWY